MLKGGGEGGWQATVWGNIPYCLNVFHVRENKHLASATYESVFAWITWFNIEYSAERWKTLLRLNSPLTWIHTEEQDSYGCVFSIILLRLSTQEEKRLRMIMCIITIYLRLSKFFLGLNLYLIDK